MLLTETSRAVRMMMTVGRLLSKVRAQRALQQQRPLNRQEFNGTFDEF
jgi:hypothetical protein